MKRIILMVLVLLLCITMAGCVTTKKVQRERVDQEITGNRGVVYGEVPPATKPASPKMREFLQIDVDLTEFLGEEYVDEEALRARPEPTPEAEQEAQGLETVAIVPAPPAAEPEIEEKPEVPVMPEPIREKVEPAKEELPTTYVVKKDESLWTIAARPEIYGKAYMWVKIYEANRDKIKDPNKIRPGTVLQIPRE